MNILHYHRFVLCLLLSFLLIFNISSILAQAHKSKPEIEVRYRDVLIQEQLDCGDFFASEYIKDSSEVHHFYNAQGEEVKVIAHQEGNGFFTNPHNGKTVTSYADITWQFDLVKESTTVNGSYYLETTDGSIIAIDAGRLVYDSALDAISFEGGSLSITSAFLTDGWFEGMLPLLEEIICPVIA